MQYSVCTGLQVGCAVDLLLVVHGLYTVEITSKTGNSSHKHLFFYFSVGKSNEEKSEELLSVGTHLKPVVCLKT